MLGVKRLLHRGARLFWPELIDSPLTTVLWSPTDMSSLKRLLNDETGDEAGTEYAEEQLARAEAYRGSLSQRSVTYTLIWQWH